MRYYLFNKRICSENHPVGFQVPSSHYLVPLNNSSFPHRQPGTSRTANLIGPTS